MLFLGIDAGSRKTGFALVETAEDKRTLIAADLLRLDIQPYTDMSLANRLSTLYVQAKRRIDRYKPDAVVVELIRMRGGGKNLDSYLIAARAMQTAELAASLSGVPVIEALASQTRSIMNILGRKREAQKAAAVRAANRMFLDRLVSLGFPKGLTSAEDDVADALMMALAGDRLLKRVESPEGFPS